MHKSMTVLAAVLAMGGASAAMAQTYVYPAKGQSAEQQQKDVADCKTWATQQTGFDPAKPAPVAAAPAPAPAPAPKGGRVRGAAAGATVAAITDNDVGDAAAVGAVAGASAQRGARRQAGAQQQAAAQQQQAAASQQQATSQANYAKAEGACLEGRGYTVK
jgi:hypothetical protein